MSLENITSFYAIKKKHLNVFIFLVVLGITCLITVFALYMVSREYHDTKKTFIQYSWILILIGTLILWYAYIYNRKKKFKVDIVSKGKSLSIQVWDPELPSPLFINYPFIVKKQWIEMHRPKGPKGRKAFITILDKLNEPIATFFYDLGYTKTDLTGYEFMDINRFKNPDKLTLANLQYSMSKLVQMEGKLSGIIQSLETTNF